MSKGPSFLFETERSSRYRVVEIERVHCITFDNIQSVFVSVFVWWWYVEFATSP